MDGVTGQRLSGIKPGETFTYRFAIRRSGTYWYRSHTGMGTGTASMPLLIHPGAARWPKHERDYVVMLSDLQFGRANASCAI